ncbi:MAG TPA: efflux transporter outer membrane subunit [Candidatus Hydrogenedentes bacterium]|nr:efflux transporter outer membrane subunit [Candidatus Hydrogenedentota bacterium]HPC15032.1 efflux transporter outer membrane subunit [Candidatus Hydrogenedentota bacterium]HRT19107.1 efflux transporter outer membrane subunit [Candidatus Hydrogenedentota bacterium]HRT64036.1 efflux transporter outer membrane subunit [Candidatus Hydrogenedentota bacterium]
MRGNKVGAWMQATAVSGLILVVCSCVTGPDYQRPALDVPGQYKSATESEKAQPGFGSDWWLLFQDPDLAALATKALEANESLKAAMARVEQARASTVSVRSSFFPVVALSPSATRSRSPGVSASGAVSPPGAEGVQSGGSSSGTTSTRLSLPFDVSYEIDIWGRLRRSYEAADATAQASVCELEVVRQTLLADLAKDYFELRSLDAQDEILTRNLALYREQVELTQCQVNAGLVDATSLLQAQVQLESARVQAADVRRQRTDLEHAIAILLGRPPSEFSLEPHPLDAVPPIIPAGLPSDLLRRRPDVAEAERNLAAACAEIGVAKADFFPSISLTGTAGFQSVDAGDLLKWQQRTWSFGPNLSLPIFNGRRLRASLQKAQARYDELQATYRGTVLDAFRDVEDSLTDLHVRADEAENQAKAVDAAREYLKLTQIQYRAGTIDYLQMIDAERTLLTNELSAAQILSQRMVSTVLLIKALGGGWEIH